MKTLILVTCMRRRLIRTVGGNPLVRLSDRVEAAMLTLVFTISLGAIPLAVAAGEAAHAQSSRAIAEQAESRQRIAAVVTNSRPRLERATVSVVTVHWRVGGREHTGTFPRVAPSGVGDTVGIWVNRDGQRVAAPPPPWRPNVDGVLVAVAAWLTCLLAAVALFAAVRYWLDRVRYAAWDREIRSLVDGGGGRANRKP